jgi:hypothetical protein
MGSGLLNPAYTSGRYHALRSEHPCVAVRHWFHLLLRRAGCQRLGCVRTHHSRIDRQSLVSKKSVRPVRRVLGPSIQWTPAHEAYYLLASILRHTRGTPPLYVTQVALLELEAHLTENPASLPFGLLAGKLCVCPQTKLLYLLLDDVTRSRSELSDEEDLRSQIKAELQALTSDAVEREKMIVGWYIGGIGEDLKLDSGTIGLHRELFPEPWQVVLVHDTESGTEKGAFVRAEPFSDRTYPTPFFEALPEKAARGKGGEHLTTLRWINYRSAEPVSPLTDAMLAELAATGGRAVLPSPWRARWSKFFRPAALTVHAEGAPRSELKARQINPAPSPTGSASSRSGVTSETLSSPPVRVVSPVTSVDTVPEEAEPTARAEASESSAEVLGPVQYIFIEGDLVAFAEAPSLQANGQDTPWPSRHRHLAVAILATVVLFAALGILVRS